MYFCIQLACDCSGISLEERIITFMEEHLSIYSWDAKMAITVAAFSVYYGEIRLLIKQPAAVNVAYLKNMHSIDVQKVGELIKAKTGIIREAIGVIHCVPKFNVYSSYFPDITNNFAAATYWMIHTVVSYATYIDALILKNE